MFSNEKIIEIKTCKHCNSNFEITDKDLEFYEKVSPILNGKKYSIPTPTLCPNCRQQRRLSFRNERKLYKRNCSASGKPIISIYSPDKPYKVYNGDFWWSDNWNPLDYGRDFDFSRNFFQQFDELLKEVPQVNIINKNSLNSEYTNISAFNKDCYLIIESSNNENCLYGYWLQKSKNIVDSSFLNNCENCYSTIDSDNCFNLFYSKNCVNCSNGYLLENCINCKDCIACTNLQNKQYSILNKEYSKEEYIKIKESIEKNKEFNKLNSDFKNLLSKSIYKYSNIHNSENTSGDYINDSKNIKSSFEIHDAENVAYSVHVWFNTNNCFDVDTVGYNSSFIYESINTALESNFNIFCNRCWSVNNSILSNNCDNSSFLFGCSGLRNKSYCILNKEYSKEEYEILVPKIIEHMMKTGEWGEFFPASISPFGYNETVAQEYFPLTRRDVLTKHLYQDGKQIFNWSDYEHPFPKVDKIIKASMLPENISDIPDDILNWAIECEVSGKPFRIVKAELEFYRKHELPIPKRHPDQRHLDRLKQRNPRKLYDRICEKCCKSVKTSYSPNKKEIIYCEDCYLKII